MPPRPFTMPATGCGSGDGGGWDGGGGGGVVVAVVEPLPDPELVERPVVVGVVGIVGLEAVSDADLVVPGLC